MNRKVRRKICVVTGTRAEYGILYPVMKAIQKHSELNLSVLATGMHLMPEFGYTMKEIKADGFTIDAIVPMYLSTDTKGVIVRGLGLGIIGIAQAFEQINPSIVVVLGDRDEALAAAIVGSHMNIPVAHVHGGDTSGGGCIDESIRHAITRFSHIHFPATPKSAERLIRMGEEPWRVHIIGPLGIYAMSKADFIAEEELYSNLGLDSNKPVVLVIQHPITTLAEKASEQMRETMEAVVELGEQAVVIYPNADSGGRAIIDVIKEYENYPFIKIYKNLPYLTFISLMETADMMIGNSSAAIVDAPLFGLPALNVGIRQESRERGANIIDVPHKKKEILAAAKNVLKNDNFRRDSGLASNPYDVERNGPRKITDILSSIEIGDKLLQRKLTY